MTGLTKTRGCKGWLMNKALEIKLDNLSQTGTLHHPCFDYIIFNKVKRFLGGRVRLMATGSAPIAQDVMDVVKVCFVCEIV
jgi:long-chain acyl-CoA synthetase